MRVTACILLLTRCTLSVYACEWPTFFEKRIEARARILCIF